MPTTALRAGDFSQAFNAGRQPADHLRPDDWQPATAPAACLFRATRFRRSSATSPSRFRRCTRSQHHRQPWLQRQRRRTGRLPQLRAPAGPEVRPEQLRLQGQLQPVVVEPDLGQVLAHGRQRELAAEPTSATTGRSSAIPRCRCTTFGDTWTISPTMVFDATFGYREDDPQLARRPDLAAGQLRAGHAGHPRHERRANFSSDPRYAGIPASSHGRLLVQLGDTGSGTRRRNSWDPVERDERTYAFASNLTKLSGAHEFRFGYSVNKLRMDHWQPELGYGPRGCMQAAPNATALNGGGQDGQHLQRHAAFLLGLMEVGGTSVQNELMTTREWQHTFYARDRWQVSDKLTLDLGLRYEYYPLMQRADRGIEKIARRRRPRQHAGTRSNGAALTPIPLARCVRRCCSAARAQVPTDLGIKVSKTLVCSASRRRVPASTRTTCSAPAGGSPITRCRSRAPCAASSR